MAEECLVKYIDLLTYEVYKNKLETNIFSYKILSYSCLLYREESEMARLGSRSPSSGEPQGEWKIDGGRLSMETPT